MELISRREFQKRALAASLAATFDRHGGFAQRSALDPADAVPPQVTRTWLGPHFWANRLQDWRLHDGRIECLTGAAGDEVRTVAWLTREMIAGHEPAHLSVRAGLIEDAGGGGFCGFLIGAGAGVLDYRAAALVQKASGTGGGVLCVYETDGSTRFRDHTSEEQPLAFAELPSRTLAAHATLDGPAGLADVRLQLDIEPDARGRFSITLTARDPQTGVDIAGAARDDVQDADLLGAIALVSSPHSGKAGARFWFTDLRSGGRKIAVRPERALGPIVGAFHSLNGTTLKVGAQLMPIGESDPHNVRLEVRPIGGRWREAATARLSPGYTAHFRIENWDRSQDAEYRLVHGESMYGGTIRREPSDRAPLTIGLFSCATAAGRSLEGGRGEPELPDAEPLGRYTSKSIYFPHAEVVRHASHHHPDLLVFAGDQLYENSPTRRDNDLTPTLDYLYKWYLWVWAFRELTRDTPAILLVDDHDVYHGNVWGNGGRPAPQADQNRGGYRCTADFIDVVQRTQCGHNPDPYDPTPVDQGIGVYYGAFRFGGVSFAVLEDRKFKTAPIQGADLDVHEAELLGPRQERFLAEWARMPEGDAPRICLTQTLFACLQTSPSGRPLVDFDANGYPKLQRDRAIRLLRDARALVLAGDQHLASVVRHGIDAFTDGVVQFSGPAIGTSWQRWFEPADPLPNAHGGNTGDFVDAFGNKLHVHAVANPKITFEHYRTYRPGRSQGLGDRRLKSEGYAIVRIDRTAREIVLECWPWNVDPAARDASQFPGWPIRIPFDEV
jgi:alkaline phosphatase D